MTLDNLIYALTDAPEKVKEAMRVIDQGFHLLEIKLNIENVDLLDKRR